MFRELVEMTTFEPSVLPIMQGYALLDTPIERENSLINKHGYAEPIIGVAQRLSGIDMRLNGKNSFLKSAFWTLVSSNCSIIIIKKATE